MALAELSLSVRELSEVMPTCESCELRPAAFEVFSPDGIVPDLRICRECLPLEIRP